jgi:hypothetical protein
MIPELSRSANGAVVDPKNNESIASLSSLAIQSLSASTAIVIESSSNADAERSDDPFDESPGFHH